LRWPLVLLSLVLFQVTMLPKVVWNIGHAYTNAGLSDHQALCSVNTDACGPRLL